MKIGLEDGIRSGQFSSLYNRCKDYTMLSKERMYAIYNTIRYIAEHKISGDIVVCGVWKGGSVMMCVETLKIIGDMKRKIYMYDTYSGMSEPTNRDIDYKGICATENWENNKLSWTSISLEDVQKNMISAGNLVENLIFVKGKVEDTIPNTIPEKISFIHLDTDWYESTYHELVHLFPRLVDGGVIIIDDYGHWKGAKDAVDKYWLENNIDTVLSRIDYTGRIGRREENRDKINIGGIINGV